MLFLPELTLLLGALAIFLVSLGTPAIETIRKLTITIGTLTVAATLISLKLEGSLFFDSYRVDYYSQLFKLLIAAATLAVLVFSGRSPGIKEDVRGEYYLFLFIGVLGLMMLTSSVELLAIQSVLGPIGQPAQEALYPPVNTEDGKPMNAMSDYEIVMAADAMPPAKAFWSVTLYDTENGFFIPNDRKKYSVGENAGFQLNEDGGIRIVIAAEQPAGVPEENWLPIERKDVDLNVIMRLYNPDLEKFKSWTPPKAKRLNL